MHRSRRVDRNQGEIVIALRRAGAFVEPIHELGGGVPDLLVGFRGVWFLLEVKDWMQPPSKRELTPDEKEWHQKAGLHAPVHVVCTIEQALKVVGAVN